MAVSQYDLYIENESTQDDKLILVQFPGIRPQFSNPDDQLHLSLKPKSLKLKLEVDLNCHSKNFSSRPQNRLIDKNVYTSTKGGVNDPQLFVCKVVGRKIVCRPLSEVVALRTDLTHLDVKEEVDPREEVKPVSVKFAATDRQNTPAKPKDTQETEESLEEFRSYKFYSVDSAEAKIQRESLFGISDLKVKPDPDASMIVDKKPTILHHDIKPKIETLEPVDIYSIEARTQPGSPRKANVIKNRVKGCLLKAKLVSFEEVYRYLKDYRDFSSAKLDGCDMVINIKDIIDALNEHAFLVQGNWAIKSEALYGDSTTRDCTDVTGVQIDLFIAARDYLLWLFNQDRYVSRSFFNEHVKLPDHDVLELFNQYSVFRKELRKWELKLPTDELFLEKFPEVVQRQNTFWKVRKANKLSIFFKN